MQKYFDYQLTEELAEIAISGEWHSPKVVNCLNPHSFVAALDDKAFSTALKNSDFLLPDGEGICMTLEKLGGKKIKKIAGDDLHKHLLAQLESQSGRVFYMGSKEETLRLIVERLKRECPSVSVMTHSPSFGASLPEEESREIVEKINAFAPDVLFVSMTAPKQEKWVEHYRSELHGIKVIASIGAVFDFYAGTVKRAPQWAIKMKMEWLVRLLKEPRRMWSRNFVSTPRFLKWVYTHRKEM